MKCKTIKHEGHKGTQRKSFFLSLSALRVLGG